MKTLFAAFLLLLSSTSFSQVDTAQFDPTFFPTDPATGRLRFQGVVQMDSVPASELFSYSIRWVAATFRSAKAVIEVEDREAGLIVCRGWSTVDIDSYGGMSVPCYYTVTFNVKEGRCRLTFTNIEYEFQTPTSYTGGPSTYTATRRSAEERLTGEALTKPNGKIRPGTWELREQTYLLFKSLFARFEGAINKYKSSDSDW